jgi:hypothetical protein
MVHAPAGFHGVVDRGSTLALDHVAGGVHLFNDEQLFVERVDDGGANRGQEHGTEPAAILENVSSHHPEADFVIALRSRPPFAKSAAMAMSRGSMSGRRSRSARNAASGLCRMVRLPKASRKAMMVATGR